MFLIISLRLSIKYAKPILLYKIYNNINMSRKVQCKNKKVSRCQTKKKIYPNKLVYPELTTRCQKHIPKQWNYHLDQLTSLNLNKVSTNILNTVKNIKYNILNQNIINSSNLKLHSLLNSKFCPYDILSDIEKNHNYNINISFTYTLPFSSISNTYTNLYVFCSYRDIKKFTKSFINKIISRILFLNFYLDTTSLPNEIHLYYSHKKKLFPKKNTRFTTQNTNSAVTDSVDIVIFRKEELLKSILHELIHFHQIDNIIYPNHLVQELINTHHISNKNPYYIRESVTEVLTTLFNAGFICYQKNNNLSIKALLKHYKTTILNEMIHNSIQVAKIMKNLSMSSFEEFCKLKNNYKVSKIQLEQDSDVFAYYILKMYLLNNLSKLIKICNNNNNKIIVNKNHNLLIHNLFNQSRKDKEFHKFINYLIKNGSNDEGMRMTGHILE